MRKYSPSLPVDDRSGPRHRRKRRWPVVVIAAVIAIAIGTGAFLAISIGSSGATAGTSAQADADLGQAVSRLARLGFGGSDNLTSSDAKPAADCVQKSTGEARRFLARNPCQGYSEAVIKTRKQGITTQAAMSWIGLSTSAVAARYKAIADENHPRGCYASGRRGDSVWVVQVQPTGRATLDREILRAIAPAPLRGDYLASNCVS